MIARRSWKQKMLWKELRETEWPEVLLVSFQLDRASQQLFPSSLVHESPEKSCYEPRRSKRRSRPWIKGIKWTVIWRNEQAAA